MPEYLGELPSLDNLQLFDSSAEMKVISSDLAINSAVFLAVSLDLTPGLSQNGAQHVDKCDFH